MWLGRELFTKKQKKSNGRFSPLGKKLYKLFNENNKCNYCGRVTKMDSRDLITGFIYDNCATLDHVYSALDIRRFIPGAIEKVVLSCYKCNQDRNNKQVRQVYNKETKSKNNVISIIELLNSEQNVQASVATEADQGTEAGNQNSK